MITVLDLPLIGRDREDTARRVERVRGRLTAQAYAARHPVGPVEVHRRRWADLAGAGVEQIFVALPDLDRAERSGGVRAPARRVSSPPESLRALRFPSLDGYAAPDPV